MSINARKLISNSHRKSHIYLFTFIISLSFTIVGEITPPNILNMKAIKTRMLCAIYLNLGAFVLTEIHIG